MTSPNLRSDARSLVSDRLRRAARAGACVLTHGQRSRDLIPECDGVTTLDMTQVAGEPQFHIDVEEQVLSADAGVDLAQLDHELARHRLCLPPLVGSPTRLRGTLGGLYCDPREWPTQTRWGRVRDQVLGIEAVRGDGSPFKAGGRVVKNVTGYDLTRLLCGSRGCWGVITRLHWRLLPRPESWQQLRVRYDSIEDAWLALERLRKGSLDPHELQLRWDSSQRVLLDIVECGRHSVVEAHSQRYLQMLLEGNRGDVVSSIANDLEADSHSSPARARDPRRRLRVRLPFGRWRSWLEQCEIPRESLRVYPWSHYATLDIAHDLPETEVVTRLGAAAANANWESGWRPLVARSEPRLNASLRQQWDPQGVLFNPHEHGNESK